MHDEEVHLVSNLAKLEEAHLLQSYRLSCYGMQGGSMCEAEKEGQEEQAGHWVGVATRICLATPNPPVLLLEVGQKLPAVMRICW
jgi:hypothetical protein